jgi:hypothetical protein
LYQTTAVMKFHSLNPVLTVFIPIVFLLSSCKGPLFLPKMKDREFYQVRVGDKIGFINERGRLVIPAIYDTCEYRRPCATSKSFYGSEYGIISKGNKFGAINSKGQQIIEPQYEYLEESPPGHFRAKKENKWSLIDLQNRPVFPFMFDNDDLEYDDTVAIGQSGKDYYLLYPLTGVMKKTEFEYISPFFDGFAEVKFKGKTGFIDTSGKLRIEAKYDQAWFFNEGLAAVKWQGKWGFIDTTGTMQIGAIFEETLGKFENGLVPVYWQCKWGYIDKKGNFKIAPEFDLTFGFSSYWGKDYAIVHQKDYSGLSKMGLINQKGEKVLSPIYDMLQFINDTIIYVSEGYQIDGKNKAGLVFINRDTSITPFNNHADISLYNDYVLSRDKSCYGVCRLKTGKTVVPFVFLELEYYESGLSAFSFYDTHKNKYYNGYLNKRGKIIWVEPGITKKEIYPGGRKKIPKHH